MEDCIVFISSSDSYADLWPVFFDLFDRFWPEFEGTIYLNTENLEFHHKRLHIKCTKVGNLKSFGKTFRAGLDQVESTNVMLIMIDYFFTGKVDNELLNKYFQFYKSENLDSLCLKKQPYDKIEPLDFEGLNLVIPPSKDMFSYQIAFWKKDVLYKMALPHESPWLSEWYGTMRANQMKIKLANTERVVIPYIAAGALHKGKWIQSIVDFLKSLNYDIDFSKRGYYEDKPVTLGQRLKARYNTFIPRFLSNVDLMKRKYL